MKEVVKISLSGISFTFDDDAYIALREYFDKLENGYRGNADGREIIADIEARIAELILSEQENTRIVDSICIRRIIGQMGTPDEIDNGPAPDSHDMDRIPRRLYRNRENAKIGGVCSGLGTYTGTDPVWFRLGIFAPLLLCIFLSPVAGGRITSLMALLFAVFVLLYILLWFAIPTAKSPRQKLEMRGEKITAESIRQNFDEARRGRMDSAGKVTSVLGEIMYVIGRILLLGIKIALGFIGFVFAISTIVVLIAFFGIAFNVSLFFNETVTTLFPSMQIIHPVLYWSMAALLVLLPLGLLTYLIFSTVFRFRSYTKVYMTVLLLWLAIAGVFTFFTIRNGRNIYNDIECASSYKVRKIRDGLHAIARSGSWEIVRGDSVVYRATGIGDRDIRIQVDHERLNLYNRTDQTTVSIDLSESSYCVDSGPDRGDIVIGSTRIRKTAGVDISITRGAAADTLP